MFLRLIKSDIEFGFVNKKHFNNDLFNRLHCRRKIKYGTIINDGIYIPFIAFVPCLLLLVFYSRQYID